MGIAKFPHAQNRFRVFVILPTGNSRKRTQNFEEAESSLGFQQKLCLAGEDVEEPPEHPVLRLIAARRGQVAYNHFHNARQSAAVSAPDLPSLGDLPTVHAGPY